MAGFIENNVSNVCEFKAELTALLRKYNATIGVDIEGDTHGLLYNFTVELDGKDHLLCEGYRYIDASDLDKQ